MNSNNGCWQILHNAIGGFLGWLLALGVGIIVYLAFRLDLFNPINNFPPPTVTNTSIVESPTQEAIEESVITNTDMPTDTNTPTEEPTATDTARPTTPSTNEPTATDPFRATDKPTDEPSPTRTPTATNTTAGESRSPEYEAALARAWNFVGTLNSDWTPYTYIFDDGIEMALVPIGCFNMGSTEEQIQYAINELAVERELMSNEQPIQQYCVEEPFWIDVTEVTQAQFSDHGGEKDNPNGFTGDDLPIESITWLEARDYCEGLGKRLPTEAEWEYAARGVQSWLYPWGDEFIGDNVVYYQNSNSQTATIGSRPNGVSWIGAFDMSGNVWEWTSSFYRDHPYGTDSENDDDRTNDRVVGGGSWLGNSFYLRAATRFNLNPDYWDSYGGLRCVRNIDN